MNETKFNFDFVLHLDLINNNQEVSTNAFLISLEANLLEDWIVLIDDVVNYYTPEQIERLKSIILKSDTLTFIITSENFKSIQTVFGNDYFFEMDNDDINYLYINKIATVELINFDNSNFISPAQCINANDFYVGNDLVLKKLQF